MSDDKNVIVYDGLPLSMIVFIVFLVLKLTGTITWSWWLVTLPLWIGPAVIVGIIGLLLGIAIPICILILIGYLILVCYDKIRK